jgi:hypothetical protein
MIGARAAATLLLALIVAAQTAHAGSGYRVDYVATLNGTRTHLQVRACVNDEVDTLRWRAYSDVAAAALRDLSRSRAQRIDRRGNVLIAPQWQQGECLTYAVDLDTLARVGGRAVASRHGEGWLLSADAWLWQAEGDAAGARVAFTLPEGWSAAAAWRTLGANAFVLGGAPPDWPVLVALGPLRQFEAGHTTDKLRVALSGAIDDNAARVLQQFVVATFDDVQRCFPHVARFAPQLTVIDIGRHADSIPYGESQRGGMGGLVLFADARRPLQDYFDNWTLTHELIHLAHPYLGARGRWVSEGIATYYQYVLRARAGRISAREAWAELHAGFDRGRADRLALPLAEVSANLSRNHRYMRAYWSGAALALTADVRLRGRAHAPVSLEQAINADGACCLRTGQYRAARDYLAQLDRTIGGDTLTALFDGYAASEQFPNVDEAYTALGLDPLSGEPRANTSAEARALRRAIMGSD